MLGETWTKVKPTAVPTEAKGYLLSPSIRVMDTKLRISFKMSDDDRKDVKRSKVTVTLSNFIKNVPDSTLLWDLVINSSGSMHSGSPSSLNFGWKNLRDRNLEKGRFVGDLCLGAQSSVLLNLNEPCKDWSDESLRVLSPAMFLPNLEDFHDDKLYKMTWYKRAAFASTTGPDKEPKVEWAATWTEMSSGRLRRKVSKARCRSEEGDRRANIFSTFRPKDIRYIELKCPRHLVNVCPQDEDQLLFAFSSFLRAKLSKTRFSVDDVGKSIPSKLPAISRFYLGKMSADTAPKVDGSGDDGDNGGIFV